jgi:drug/metabolite transporter (DMT)-like permease
MKIAKNVSATSSIAFAFIVLVIVWGCSFRFARLTVTGQGAFPPLTAVSIRYAVAACLLLIQWLVQRDKKLPTLRQFLGIVAGSSLLGIANVALVVGLVHTSAAVGAVVSATIPSMVLFLTFVHTRAKVGSGPWIGVLASLVGIVLLSWDRLKYSTNQAHSIGLMLFFALAFSIGTYICEKNSRGVDGLTLTTLSITNMAVLIWLLKHFVEKSALPSPLRLNPTLALICMAVFSTVIAFQCYFRLLEQTSSFVVSTVYFFQPVVAMILDKIWEHDVVLTAASYGAIALVLFGSIICITTDPSRRRRPT